MKNRKKKDYNPLLFLLIISYFLTGCSNDRLVKCKEIIAVTLKIEEEIKTNLNNQNSKDITKVADAIDNTAKEIKNIKIRDEQLEQYNQELGALYQDYASETREFLEGFQDKNLDKALLHKKNIDDLFVKQQELVKNINNYCEP
jgi:hypothetical protein